MYPAVADAVTGKWKARLMRSAAGIRLSDSDVRKLQEGLSRNDFSPRVHQRIRIALAANQGMKNQSIASMLNCSRRTVGIWRQRIAENGIDRILAASSRPGRRPVRRMQVEQTVLKLCQNQQPRIGRRWTVRSLAAAVNVSKDTVLRILQSHEIDLRDPETTRSA